MSMTLEDVACRVLARVAPGRSLADCEWRTLVSAAEVLLDRDPESISPETVADNVERFLAQGRSPFAWRVRVLFTLLEHVSLPIHGKRFSELTLGQRRALIEQRFIGGRGIWGICAKVRLLVLMGAYSDPRAAAATGFVPVDHRVRFRVRSIERALELDAAS